MSGMNNTSSLDVIDLTLDAAEDYGAEYPTEGFPLEEEDMGGATKHYRTSMICGVIRGKKWIIAMIFAVLLVVSGIVVVSVGASSKGVSRLPSYQPPVVVDPSTLNAEAFDDTMDTLLAVYSRNNLDPSALDDDAGDTPQKKALHWLVSHKGLKSMDHTQKIQKYALAVLYYATNEAPNAYEPSPRPWQYAHLWLTRAHVCEWQGISCNDRQRIQTIDLESNNLSGSLPMELAFLKEHLYGLDVSTNLIYMVADMYDLFKHLTNLEILMIDDNYLSGETGLPAQFAFMPNIEKLRLSYNLFAGEFDGNNVIANWPNLTHLEVESNYFTGTMPASIGEKEWLVYMYMRRNEMTFNLDFLKSGQLSNLFALWLDSNHIQGTIPTEIGLLTHLASLSITNATLTGSIPTEMGNLSELRRLWLYDNELTGQIPQQLGNLEQLEVFEVHHNNVGGAMPQGICTTLEEAEYVHKSLTSDCNSQVQCAESCCTQCYD